MLFPSEAVGDGERSSELLSDSKDIVVCRLELVWLRVIMRLIFMQICRRTNDEI